MTLLSKWSILLVKIPILRSNQVVLLYWQVKFPNWHWVISVAHIRKIQNQHLQCSCHIRISSRLYYGCEIAWISTVNWYKLARYQAFSFLEVSVSSGYLVRGRSEALTESVHEKDPPQLQDKSSGKSNKKARIVLKILESQQFIEHLYCYYLA